MSIFERVELAIAHGFTVTIDNADDWQTLKEAVLAQQTTNKQSTTCPECSSLDVIVEEYRCVACGEWFVP